MRQQGLVGVCHQRKRTGCRPAPATHEDLVQRRFVADAETGSGSGLRYYDPAQHRWTQTDPLERVTNPGQPAESQPYTYTGCNPTNQTDPTGAHSCGENLFLLAAGVVGVGASLYGMIGAAVAAPPTGGMSVMAGVPAAGLFLLGVATIPYAASDVAETC